MPKISIIVPIYNVEQYIDKCLNSIKKQTLKDIEIIMVNDGSKDKSIDIASKYLEDQRFKLYHKENGGLSSARNYGMKFAIGEYLAFVDSDDYIAPTMYEKMYDLATKEKSDIVECDFIWEYEKKGNIDKTYVNEKNLFTCIRVLAWNKLYKRSLIEKLDISFTHGVRYEDVDWCYKILPYVKKFSSLKEPMYHYIQRSDSIANTQNEKVRDVFVVLKNVFDFYKEKNIYDIYEKEIEYLFIKTILGSSFIRILEIKNKKLKKEILLENWNFLNNYFPNWKKNKILRQNRFKDKDNFYYYFINKPLYFISSIILNKKLFLILDKIFDIFRR